MLIGAVEQPVRLESQLFPFCTEQPWNNRDHRMLMIAGTDTFSPRPHIADFVNYENCYFLLAYLSHFRERFHYSSTVQPMKGRLTFT